MGLFELFKKHRETGKAYDIDDLFRYKAEFFQKMQPYYDAGLIRNIYVSDHLCILAFGELLYVACPYIPISDMPVGIYMNEHIMKQLVEKNRLIYLYVNEVFSDVKSNRNLIYDFSASKIDIWKEWLKEERNKVKSAINPIFEKEIQMLSKHCM